MDLQSRRFCRYWLSTVSLYCVLTGISFWFEPYHAFPAYGLLGYTAVILLLLYTISQAERRWHYITGGLTLVLAGVIGSIDIVLSRTEIVHELQQLHYSWARKLFNDEYTVANLVNILVILLNIFTSSLAADVLFHGLNRRNFPAQNSLQNLE